MIYDALFSIGILDSDISFEVNAVDNKLVPICHFIDNEHEQIPDKLLYDEYGIPLPRKPIIYCWVNDKNCETFNWNPLLKQYNSIYLRIQKFQKMKEVIKRFDAEVWSKIKKINICGIDIPCN